MSIEAMKQALEALERSVATCFDQYAHQQAMSRPDHFINQAITSLRQAIAEAEKQERGEPVDLSSFLCGYAQIKDGQYKFANMRTVELLTKDEFGPIYAIPEELIDSLYTHPQPKAEKQELYGWVSKHTTKGMYEWQFNKELSGVYKDTAISILPVYTNQQPKEPT